MSLHPDKCRQTNFEAWKKCLEENSSSSLLKKQLAEDNKSLFKRFSFHYEKLSSLPRKARRAMQRKWKHSLAGIALVLALGAGPAIANDITVDPSAVDTTPATCSIVEAIQNANDTVDGQPNIDCAAGDPAGADTVILDGSAFTFTNDNSDPFTGNGNNALPPVTTRITIEGNGSVIERSDAEGTDSFRLIAVSDGGNLTLNNTTISGGLADNDAIAAGDGGGGILNFYSSLTINNSSVSGNWATASGGGVVNAGANSYLTILNSNVEDNSAQNAGGVFNFQSQNFEITGSTISGNTANYAGGGIENHYGTTTITNSTVSGNTANFAGGGIENYYGASATITNSTISGNTANYGGGIDNFYSASATITNSTISGNTANYGGGIYNFYSASATITNSIVSGNTATNGAEIYNNYEINADSFNLFGHDSLADSEAFAGTPGFSPGTDDINATSDNDNIPLSNILDTNLADNGGPTLTHTLVTGSPAIDGVADGHCVDQEDPPNDITIDQRYFPRPVDGDGMDGALCDIGAFELQPTASVTITKETDPPGRTGFNFTSAGAGNAEECQFLPDFTLDDGESRDLILPLTDQTCLLTEIQPEDPSENQVSIQCSEQTDDLTIDEENGSITFTVDEEGEAVNCTFVNFIPQMVFDINDEPAGANCENGGVRIDEGTDLDEDGILDQNEIEETRYVCDGDDGASGDEGTPGRDGDDIVFNTRPEPPGKNCPNGGTRIEVGSDTSGNGELDTTEVENTFFTCNGAAGPQGEPGNDESDNVNNNGGGEGCSVASAKPNRRSALSNLFVTLIPAIAGFGAMYFRRKED